MTPDEALDALLRAYAVYYDVRRAAEDAPFDARARFSAAEAQYVFHKSVRLDEARDTELVFFAKRPFLSKEELDRLHALAWARGLAEARPCASHRCTDVCLVVAAERAAPEAKAAARRCTHSRAYRFGLWGYSRYRLAVLETATGTAFFNRQGARLAPLMADVLGAPREPLRQAERLPARLLSAFLRRLR